MYNTTGRRRISRGVESVKERRKEKEKEKKKEKKGEGGGKTKALLTSPGCFPVFVARLRLAKVNPLPCDIVGL